MMYAAEGRGSDTFGHLEWFFFKNIKSFNIKQRPENAESISKFIIKCNIYFTN